MSKKQRANASAPAPGVDVTIVVDKVLYDLLQTGKINQVFTWKNMEGKKPATVAVMSEEGDDPIVRKVKHMDIVGFGYLPVGYPEAFKADRKTTRFILTDEAAEVSQTEEESETTNE